MIFLFVFLQQQRLQKFWMIFLSQSPDVHFVDPLKVLEVSPEHENGEEVDAQLWMVHVSEIF